MIFHIIVTSYLEQLELICQNWERKGLRLSCDNLVVYDQEKSVWIFLKTFFLITGTTLACTAGHSKTVIISNTHQNLTIIPR